MSASNGKSAKRALLGMPGYGELTAGAARGLWRSSRGLQAAIPLDLAVRYVGGSLLAQNFNKAWCQAMNMAHREKRMDYFAMLHADVEPPDCWLDMLIAEMESRGLDVLAAVIPIKDNNGYTSTALRNRDTDPWRILGRLTIEEIHHLPETFTAEDIGHELLLNTGCWVCKFDLEWAKKVHFEINDRIVFDEKLDLYVAQVEPEDWNFSRQLNDLGLKIGATRKIGLSHVGPVRFINNQPWGLEKFDSMYLPSSVLENRPAKPAAEGHYYQEIQGYFDFEHVYKDAVEQIPDGGAFVEIGTWRGQSLSYFLVEAKNSGKLISINGVDHFQGSVEDPKLARMCQQFDIEAECRANLKRAGYPFRLWNSRSVEASKHFDDGEIDYLFIDGSHDFDSVLADLKAWLPKVKPGGWIAGHDINQEGVKRALQEVFPDGGIQILPRSENVRDYRWGLCWRKKVAEPACVEC